ncbi:MAG: hypothetical protein U5P10_06430 [Spirochaetia bacterium]|nr:hypothetical protein [Spirochaetia bacterium]
MKLAPSIEAAIIAKRNGVKVSFDLDIPSHDLINELGLCSAEELDELIRLCDYFIPCIGAAEQLADTADPLKMAETLQQRYGNEVVALICTAVRAVLWPPPKRVFRVRPLRLPP